MFSTKSSVQKIIKDKNCHYIIKNNINEKIYYHIKSAGETFHAKNEKVVYPIKDSILMIYVIEGSLTIESNTFSNTLSKGEAAFINCYKSYTLIANENIQIKWMQFDGANIIEFCEIINQLNGAIVNSNFLMENFIYYGGDFSNFEEFVNFVFDNLALEKKFDDIYISLIIYHILCKSLCEKVCNDSINYTKILYEAVNYIDENISRKITLSQITSSIGISPSALNKLFNNVLHVSPYNYIQEKRMEKAKIMLKKSDKSIYDICFDCGFSYLPNFTKAFIKYNNLTPSQYRKITNSI